MRPHAPKEQTLLGARMVMVAAGGGYTAAVFLLSVGFSRPQDVPTSPVNWGRHRRSAACTNLGRHPYVESRGNSSIPRRKSATEHAEQSANAACLRSAARHPARATTDFQQNVDSTAAVAVPALVLTAYAAGRRHELRATSYRQTCVKWSAPLFLLKCRLTTILFRVYFGQFFLILIFF